jgi:uncharacterized protein involved in exopolysaccharide biosynthesis
MTSSENLSPTLGRLFLWRRRILRAALITGALALVVAFVYPRDWTTEASFVVQDPKADALKSLGGVTAQFGIDLSSSSSSYSPRFFAAFIRSEEVLRSIAALPLPFASGTGAQGNPVADALPVRGRSAEIKRARAASFLRREVLSALFDQRTGITSYTVTTRDPKLSRFIAAAMLDQVNGFAAERHQSKAKLERRFLEDRKATVEAELRLAEDRVAAFLRANRAYQQSPDLTVEFGRLTRAVNELQAVHTNLTQSYEQARIEAVRDSPILTLVQSPVVPVLPDSRSPLQWALATVLMAIIASVALAVSASALGYLREERVPVVEASSTILLELRRPWKLFF